jgi:ribosome maturation factor RimP
VARNFFDPTPEQQNVVLIDAATLHTAQRMIAGCEACSEDAEIPFDNIVDRLTGSDPSVTDYVLEVSAPGSRLLDA